MTRISAIDDTFGFKFLRARLVPPFVRQLEVPRMVGWRKEIRGGRPQKPPYDLKTGYPASVVKPSTWSLWEVVEYGNKHGFDGVGIVLTPELNLVGIDLDDCFDRTGGDMVLLPWAQRIVDRFMDATYIEFSPSRKGIHIFARGELHGPGRKLGGVEMYSKERYMTFTGFRLGGSLDDIR
jgi:primase-polymerase (primpol)-like protein